MRYRVKTLARWFSANRYILVALVLGIGLGLLLWLLSNEPIPQVVPERSLRI